MKATTIIGAAAFVAIACGLFSMAGSCQKSRDMARYERTTESLLQFVNELQEGCRAAVPEHDAWGARIAVTTNDFVVVYVSDGAEANDIADDVILQIDQKSRSYSLSYSYDSHNFAVGAQFD